MSKTLQKLQKAATLHRAGQYDTAGEIYQQVLKIEPRNFDALQLSGLIALHKGERENAIRLIGRCGRYVDRASRRRAG